MFHHRLNPRQYLILGMVAICAPLGDSCLARGMIALPAIAAMRPGALIAALFTPWIAIGIALLIGFFSSYLHALSWADLTYVVPASSAGYVLLALIARFALHENVSLMRWLGIALVSSGVGFVTTGPERTPRRRKRA